METFTLIPNFQEKKVIAELPVSIVLLQETIIPWILLIPKRANVLQINQLALADQLDLTKEINYCSNVMEKLFPCDRLNVAAIGNKCPQLHIHIICRTKDDPLWPETIWGQDLPQLTPAQIEERLVLLKQNIQKEEI